MPRGRRDAPLPELNSGAKVVQHSLGKTANGPTPASNVVQNIVRPPLEDRGAGTMIIAGIQGQDSPRPPNEQHERLPRPGGVGDAASAALNAAALQELSMKGTDHEYRLYRGRILPIKPGKLLAGQTSQDTSYIADQNLLAAQRPRRRRVAIVQERPKQETAVAGNAPAWAAAAPSAGEVADLVAERAGLPFADEAQRRRTRAPAPAEPVPSSRAEAVAAADQLRRGLSVRHRLPEFEALVLSACLPGLLSCPLARSRVDRRCPMTSISRTRWCCGRRRWARSCGR